MPYQRRTIEIDPESTVGVALREAAQSGEELAVVVGNRTLRVRVSSSDDALLQHDLEYKREVFRRSAGVLKGVDVEQLLRDLRDLRG